MVAKKTSDSGPMDQRQWIHGLAMVDKVVEAAYPVESLYTRAGGLIVK